jgi:hypothetical protein
LVREWALAAFGPRLTLRMNQMGVRGVGPSPVDEADRAALRSVVLRLGRDHSGRRLAVAIGQRVAATPYAALPAADRDLFRRMSAPGVVALIEEIEPLSLQTRSIQSLLPSS